MPSARAEGSTHLKPCAPPWDHKAVGHVSTLLVSKLTNWVILGTCSWPEK